MTGAIQTGDVYEWMGTHLIVLSIRSKTARIYVQPNVGGQGWSKTQPLPLPAEATLCSCPLRTEMADLVS